MDLSIAVSIAIVVGFAIGFGTFYGLQKKRAPIVESMALERENTYLIVFPQNAKEADMDAFISAWERIYQDDAPRAIIMEGPVSVYDLGKRGAK